MLILKENYKFIYVDILCLPFVSSVSPLIWRRFWLCSSRCLENQFKNTKRTQLQSINLTTASQDKLQKEMPDDSPSLQLVSHRKIALRVARKVDLSLALVTGRFANESFRQR